MINLKSHKMHFIMPPHQFPVSGSLVVNDTVQLVLHHNCWELPLKLLPGEEGAEVQEPRFRVTGNCFI